MQNRQRSPMSERIIPIADARYQAGLPAIPPEIIKPNGLLVDQRARRLHDLRISVTDRCNFRCTYCMPSEIFDKDYAFLPQSSLLSFEEIERLAKIFATHGVEKIRLTGGEPLLRKHIEKLIEKLAQIKTPNGKTIDLTLTTNASLLPRKAQALRDAGLQRITVSLDAIDDQVFRQMNDVDFPVADVLAGIEAAHRVGLTPVKINMVVKRGVNEHQILPMVRHFKGSGHIVRFIEYMDVGTSNGWQMQDVIPSAQVIQMIHEYYPIKGIEASYGGEVAQRWAFADGSGEIGVISSVTQTFCHDCTRARLSTEGKLFTCLFATEGQDLRGLLRGNYGDDQIAAAVGLIWAARQDRYSEIRSELTPQLRADRPKVEMSYIGG
jgi:GTP 3',8-cyclase